MTGMWAPCCGKGEASLVLKIDGGRLRGGASGQGGCGFHPAVRGGKSPSDLATSGDLVGEGDKTLESL